MRALAVLTVRNEAAYLLEWLAHHKAIGFTDFLVFSNNCQDGTDVLLDRLDAMGHLTHLRNDGPYDKGGIQFTALKTASKHPLVKAADWILPLDVDEFVNIHTGDGTLTALFSALPDATAITLTWRLFGSSDQIRYHDTLVTDTFTRCAPVVMYWPWRSAMFKTLYRNDGAYKKLGVHRPRDADDDKVANTRWYDGEGRTLDDQFKHRRIFSPYGRSNYGLVQLNHYPLGSMENYVLKADRGRAVHSDDLLGMDYWVERNWNTDEDRSISRYKESRDALLHDLKTDSHICQIHTQSVAWRKERFDALLRQEPFRALFGRLLMAPQSRPVSLKAAQFMVAHAHAGRSSSQD